MTEPRLKWPEAIEVWARREFAPKYVGRVVNDLIDVASGTRAGNEFEHEALNRIAEERERGRL